MIERDGEWWGQATEIGEQLGVNASLVRKWGSRGKVRRYSDGRHTWYRLIECAQRDRAARDTRAAKGGRPRRSVPV